MDNYFLNRHTCRTFSEKKVPDSLLSSIVDAAVHAPTTGNMQLYSVIATREPEMRRKLSSLHFNQPAAINAPLILTICADLNKFCHWCDISDADHGFDNYQGMTYALLDAVIFAQQIVTIAEMDGLGTCYLGTATFNAPEIANLLKLPKRVIPICALAIGYPSGDSDITERIGSRGILHFETYPELSDEDIKKIYAVKDNYPANAGYAKEHGKRNIAQVFTDVRYSREMNENFSTPFVDFLHKQGFRF